jgi:hypothetical protein
VKQPANLQGIFQFEESGIKDVWSLPTFPGGYTILRMPIESKLRLDDEEYEDEKGGKSQNKLDGFSSPRKRLAQAKIQANAIDDEVN